ncbi:MAG: bifunctional DNA primase/polymerase, partial [Thermoguttaceae bacterium]|nr:bifunctional DNA primase/polymerase [Thermoguttaceae bacterium]
MPVWLLDDALALARKGFKVFPLTPKTKRPSTPNGCVDASTDEATVRARWGTSLAAARNIGVACQNVFVLDVDVKKL